VVGDHSGIIPIESIDFLDATVDGDIGRTTVRLNFFDPLPDDRARALTRPALSKQTRTEPEVREALEDAATIEGRDDYFARAIEKRRRQLVQERQKMLDRMRRHSESDALAPWLDGLDDISPGTFDVLTVTILFSE